MPKPNFDFLTFLKLSTTSFLLCFSIILPVQAEEGATTTDDNLPEILAPIDVTTSTSEMPNEEHETAPALIQVNLNLRYQNNLLFSGAVTVPSSTNITDTNNTTHLSNSITALNALIAADQQSDNFFLSEIQYYPDWDSLYLKCLNITTPTTTKLCDNWNYVVNETYPSLSIDKFTLTGGENIYIYFNNSWQITASTSTLPANTSTTFYTWRYNYDNLEKEWALDNNNLIDVSIPNPNSTGWWDTTISTATIKSDNEGKIEYAFNTTGTYYAKITSADWTKWSWPITVTVTEPLIITTTGANEPTVASEQSPTSGNNSNGGGNGNTISGHQVININKAAQYLLTNQSADGSIGSILVSDWSAIALAAAGQNNEQIKNYLLADPSATGGLNEVSDNARRAMALMALKINPYNGTKTNYIQKIIDSFDGTQFGDRDLYNDDIFALFPLLHAGYTATDALITSTVGFILSKQNVNGAWDGIDLTAAAIQALSQARNLDGVNIALIKAKDYLSNQQQTTGGWNNTFTTSWAAQAVAALGEPKTSWMKENKTPDDYLYAQQSIDGGLEKDSTVTSTRLWATSYAIPAALGKTWSQILNDFAKPANGTNEANGVGGFYPDTLATTTPPTSTPWVAITPSSTLEITPEITITPVELLATNTKKLSTSELENKETFPLMIATKNNTAKEKTENQKELRISAAPTSNENNTEKIINALPLDTPTRRTAKKIAAATGGGALIVGLYLGFRLFKNVI